MSPTPPDLHAALHKALRCLIFDVLVQVGRVDPSDAEDLARAAQRVRHLLALVNEAPAALLHGLERLQRGPLERRSAAAASLYAELCAWSVATLQRLAEPPRHRATARRPLDALDDAELREALHWLGRALSPQELAALLAELQAAAQGDRLGLALDALGASLDATRWDQLARAMGIPQVTLPGTPRQALPLAA